MKLDSLIKMATTAAPTLSNNKNLPAMPAWQARSFWLTLITMLVALTNSFGIDILAVFGEIGLGSSPDAVIDNASRGVSAVQTLIPFVTGAWAWIERRAPNFRLTLGKADDAA